MASNKTSSMNLDIWAEMDFFKRGELNGNFSKIDQEFQERGVNIKRFGAVEGTDASDAINSAIQYAKNQNINKVIIPNVATPFLISLEKPIIVPSNFTVEGIGDKTHLKVIPSTSRKFNTAVTGGDEKFIYGRGTVLSAGDIDTKKTYQRASKGENIKIINVNIDGSQSEITKTGLDSTGNHYGINVQFVNGLVIKDCRVNNCVGTGIYTYVTSDTLIENNECNNNGQLPFVPSNRNGISVAGSASDTSEDIIVRNNVCKYNLNAGIMFGVQNRISIENNIIVGNLHKGIEGDNHFLSTSSTIKGDVMIHNNFIDGTLMTALEVSSGNNGKISITNNQITGYGCYGIYVIQNNNSVINISDNRLIDGGTYLKGDVTSGSTVITNVANIYYWQQENVHIGDSISGTGIPAGAKISAIDAVNNTITMTVAATATATGVAIYDIAYNAINVTGHIVKCEGNVIRGHKIGHGVSIRKGYDFKLNANKIDDVNLDGMYIGLTSSQDAVIDNIHINDNSFKTIGANAVTLEISNATYKVSSVKLSGNSILNPAFYTPYTRYGIQFKNNTTITSLNITNNDIVDTNATPKAANSIMFESTTTCTRAIVANNDFTNVKTAEINGVARITSLKAKNNFNITDTP